MNSLLRGFFLATFNCTMNNRSVGNLTAATILLVGFALSYYGLHYCFTKVELPPHLAQAGQLQFLTNLSLIISLLVYALGFLSHVTNSHRLYVWKNNVHPVALALESVVTSVYWPLRLFLLPLLVKDPGRKMIPMSVDICVHLVPFVVLVVDYLVYMPRWEISASTAFGVCTVLTTGYWAWLKYLIDFQSGAEYPYNFLNGDSEATRIMIFAVVGLVGFSLFLACRAIYAVVETTSEKKKNE